MLVLKPCQDGLEQESPTPVNMREGRGAARKLLTESECAREVGKTNWGERAKNRPSTDRLRTGQPKAIKGLFL